MTTQIRDLGMIEFRLHEGRTQYRTWEVDAHKATWDDETSIADGALIVSYIYDAGHRYIAWTEWQDVPVSPGNPHTPGTDNKNWRDIDKALTPYRAMFCNHEEVHISADRSFCPKCNTEL